MDIKTNYSLQKLNSFGLDVSAKHFVTINTTAEASEFVKNYLPKLRPSLIIGEGSNLLFVENYDGVIIKVNIKGIHVVKEDKHFFWVKAGAGVRWQELVEGCIKANFGGIENLSLIPGTVGAAPIQNIGAYGVEIKDVFEALEAIDLENGGKKYFTNKECNFGYRNSIFKNELKDTYLITNVVLRLSKHPTININYGAIKDTLQKMGKKEVTIQDVSEAVIEIRQSKLPDPNKVGNAGSFFKNPIIPNELYEALKISFPQIPFYEQPENKVKIPAAWLIDQCQLKGKKHKGAEVHNKQPLVLINQENATGNAILELSRLIQKEVKKKFGILLEPEVRII